MRKLIHRPLRFGEYVAEIEGDSARQLSSLPGNVEMFVSVHDPFQKNVGKSIVDALCILLADGRRLTLTSKLMPSAELAERIRECLQRFPDLAERLRLGPSLGNDGPTARILEPNAVEGKRRWELAAFAREIGAKVITSLAPLHPGLTDSPAEIYRLVKKAVEISDVVYIEIVNPKPDLEPVIRAYAHALVKESDPDLRAQIFGALRTCWQLMTEDPRGTDYTYRTFSIVRDVIAALGTAAKDKVNFWPDPHSYAGLDPTRKRELRETPWVLLRFDAYARRNAVSLFHEESRTAIYENVVRGYVSLFRRALIEGGAMGLRAAVVDLLKRVPIRNTDVKRLIVLAERGDAHAGQESDDEDSGDKELERDEQSESEAHEDLTDDECETGAKVRATGRTDAPRSRGMTVSPALATLGWTSEAVRSWVSKPTTKPKVVEAMLRLAQSETPLSAATLNRLVGGTSGSAIVGGPNRAANARGLPHPVSETGRDSAGKKLFRFTTPGLAVLFAEVIREWKARGAGC